MPSAIFPTLTSWRGATFKGLVLKNAMSTAFLRGTYNPLQPGINKVELSTTNISRYLKPKMLSTKE